MKTIAIIGGGAAGLAAAVAAGEQARCNGADARVQIYEATDRVGRSVLATGNGRCNFSNRHITPSVYNDPEYVSQVLDAFESSRPDKYDPANAISHSRHAGSLSHGASDNPPLQSVQEVPNGVVEFFQQHGMMWREEGDGRLYPLANKSSVVLDILRTSARMAGVEELCEMQVKHIEPPHGPGKPFTLVMRDGEFKRADAVIVAVGGKVASALLPESFAFNSTTPVLCPIATPAKYVRELENIRVKGSLSLRRGGKIIASQSGEVMFRKFGVSGICAFNLSREAQSGDTLLVDMLPGTRQEEVAAMLLDRQASLQPIYGSAPTYADVLRGIVLPQVADVICKKIGLVESAPFAPSEAGKVADQLHAFDLEVTGLADPQHAQVQRGGFDPWQFQPATLEALSLPGLHVVGEALDVDAPCGGFNLHWAFATGILAGRAAVA